MSEGPLRGRIVIAESDFTLSNVLKTFFWDNRNLNTSIAKNGEDCLEFVVKKLPDLVLLAVSLEDMSGTAVYDKLRSINYTSHIPVIFMVANETDHAQLKNMALPCDDFLTQQIKMQEFYALAEAAQATLLQSTCLRSLEKMVNDTLIGLGKDQYRQVD